MKDKFTTLGFADYCVEQKKHTNTFLDTINQIIGWEVIEKLLKKKYKKTFGAEETGLSIPTMFMLLLL